MFRQNQSKRSLTMDRKILLIFFGGKITNKKIAISTETKMASG